MKKRKIVLGIGGSSGAIYAKLLMDKLSTYKEIELSVVMSDNALINWKLELGEMDKDHYPFQFYGQKNFFAPFASGSSSVEAMVVCPCSMGLLARISNGISDSLMTRAADVMLKERRKLILVPRETPYNLIHLQNMTRLTEAGAIICPATPSFYSKPYNVEDLCMTVVDRVLDLLNIDSKSFRWGE